MDIQKVQQLLNHLYTDLNLLRDGDWEPDYHSTQDSIDNLEEVASELGLNCEMLEFNPNG